MLGSALLKRELWAFPSWVGKTEAVPTPAKPFQLPTKSLHLRAGRGQQHSRSHPISRAHTFHLLQQAEIQQVHAIPSPAVLAEGEAVPVESLPVPRKSAYTNRQTDRQTNKQTKGQGATRSCPAALQGVRILGVATLPLEAGLGGGRRARGPLWGRQACNPSQAGLGRRRWQTPPKDHGAPSAPSSSPRPAAGTAARDGAPEPGLLCRLRGRLAQGAPWPCHGFSYQRCRG